MWFTFVEMDFLFCLHHQFSCVLAFGNEMIKHRNHTTDTDTDARMNWMIFEIEWNEQIRKRNLGKYHCTENASIHIRPERCWLSPTVELDLANIFVFMFANLICDILIIRFFCSTNTKPRISRTIQLLHSFLHSVRVFFLFFSFSKSIRMFQSYKIHVARNQISCTQN